MIKRLIFDVDNTIIEWKDKYLDAIKETVEEYKLDVNYIDINNVIEEYEKYYNKFIEDNLIKLINKRMNLKIDKDFVNAWLDRLANITEPDEEVCRTIKYLRQKYELVILSNWFIDNQKKRLKKAKLFEYFKEIYCGNNTLKPNRSAFITAMNGKKIEECIMIGDNYKVDIEPCLKMKMKAIMVTNKEIKKENLTCIKDINEIKNIL